LLFPFTVISTGTEFVESGVIEEFIDPLEE
jgi:hypothetical protein